MGHTGPLKELRRGPQAGKYGDPRSQNADSSPRAQGALGLGFEAKPKGKCGVPRAPIACGLGRRVVVDWTWVSPLPHVALIPAWLGGHGILHSYLPVAGNTLPDFFASSYLCLLFQSNSSSALIAMAPNRTEKGKKPMSSASPPPAVEPVVGRSRVLNQEAMDKVRPALATSFNEWGGDGRLACIPSLHR